MMLRSITAPLVRPLVRGVTAPSFGWSPRALFANGEQGAWYDPSDLSTLYQDAAGTTPVTALGQPVGLMLDKSGRGNHASQVTSTVRPTLQQDANGKYYLQFDGVDDSLSTSNIQKGSNSHLMVAGFKDMGTAGLGNLVNWGQKGSGLTAIAVSATNGAATARLDTAVSPNVGYNQTRGMAAAADGNLHTLTYFADATTFSLAKDRSVITSAATTGPNADFSSFSYPIVIGGASVFANLPSKIALYGLIVVSSNSPTTDAQIAAAERYAANKTGVTL